MANTPTRYWDTQMQQQFQTQAKSPAFMASKIISDLQVKAYKQSVELIVAKLTEELGQSVYLTGSHYFGTAMYFSDVDVFTEYTQAAVQKLTEMGFKAEPYNQTKYSDQSVAMVMRAEGIDVQLCHDVVLKQQVQERIKGNKYYTAIIAQGKHSAKMLWRALMEEMAPKADWR